MSEDALLTVKSPRYLLFHKFPLRTIDELVKYPARTLKSCVDILHIFLQGFTKDLFEALVELLSLRRCHGQCAHHFFSFGNTTTAKVAAAVP